MPDRKISQLTAGGAAQATDEYVIARSGNNFKVTGADVAAAATSVGTLSSLTVSGNATFDTNTLFVDAANNRVGVGIASSLASVLHIKGPAGSNPATGGIVFQYSTNSNNYGAIGLDNASGSFAVLAGSGAELRFHTNSDLATTNLRWRMDTNGHFLANADNTYDIGASGATRPRNVFVAGNVTAGGNLTAGNSISLSVNASGPVTISATNTSTNAAATARLELGSQAGNWYIENRRTSGALAFTFGTDRMLLDSSGNITAGGNINISAGNVLHLAGAGGNTYLQESSGTLFLGAGGAGRVQVNASGNVGVGGSPLTRLHVRGTGTSSGVKLTLSNGGEIAALNDPLGVIDFYSDDVSTGASGIKGYLGVYNQFNGNWDGSLVRHLTYMAFATSFDSVVAERMRLDASGNLGIGVTPSAGAETGFGLQTLGDYFYSRRGMTHNARYNGSAWVYNGTDLATLYQPSAGIHRWFTAPSGTAGNTITFTQAMTLDASGNLLLGQTSDALTQANRVVFGINGSTDSIISMRAGASLRGFLWAQSTSFGIAANNTPIVFSGGASGATELWRFSSNGHFLAGTDNTYDIGASGATRPRTVYAATSVEGGYIRAGAASAGAASTTTIGNGTATTVGAAGAASALPANPLGYIIAHVGTTQVKIPYYNN